MAELAKKYTDRLDDLKGYVESWQEYFQDNINRYKEFMRFVFRTGLTDKDVRELQELGKPTIEFNILEAYISRQRGEFAKNQPDLTVRAADGLPASMLDRKFSETLDVIEGHLRSIFSNGMNDSLAYNIFSDLLGGGFSVMQVYTDYINEKSFEQNIYVDRTFDPTLCGFDPLARESHKGDGRFYFELYPMTKEEFEAKYGSKRAESMKFTRGISGFGWSYKNDKEDIVLIADFYEKTKKKAKIMKLSNGDVVTQEEYDEMLEEWEESGRIEQPPQPLGTCRMTEFVCIDRYKFCETEVIEHTKTSYKYLPGVFVDGNSVMLSEGQASYQMTRPFAYHAQGIQRLKTFAGQSLANELENMVQHKWVAAVESIPEDYKEAYKDVQKADVLLYNHFLDSRQPEVILPPPREIARPPIPPQITDTFRMSDEMTQAILGSYDNSLGRNGGNLSGVAIARGALQSNQSAVPYVMGYIKGLNRVAQIMIDLIPKYYRTPRSLPVLLPNGERQYVLVNQEGSLYMNYAPESMKVKVEAGASFAMQKELALQTIDSLMKSSKLFEQFINEEGLSVILDNLDIRGIDQLKSKAAEFEQKIKQQQQQAQQMQMQQMQSQQTQQQQQAQQAKQMQDIQMATAQKELQSPTKEQIDMEKLKHQMSIDEANLDIKQEEAQDKTLEIVSKIRDNQVDNELKEARIDAENTRSSIEAAISIDKHIGSSEEPGE